MPCGPVGDFIMSTPQPTQNIILTAVAGGTAFTPEASKALLSALQNGAATGPIVSMLQMNGAAMKSFLQNVTTAKWNTTTNTGYTATIGGGPSLMGSPFSATVDIQPLTPQVRQQYNPGDQVSSYICSIQFGGMMLSGTNHYFIGFNGIDGTQQPTILQELLQRFTSIVQMIAANAVAPNGSTPAAQSALQTQIQQTLSAPVTNGAYGWAIMFGVAAPCLFILRCLARRFSVQIAGTLSADVPDYAVLSTAEEDALLATADASLTCCVPLLLVLGIVCAIMAIACAIAGFVANTYTHTLIAVNLTQSTQFAPSVPYTANTLNTPASGSLANQYLDPMCLAPAGPQGSLQAPCPGIMMFTMSNQGDNTVLEGFNYITTLQAVNPPAGAPVQNVTAVFNIPRFGDNSMALWVNQPSTNYGALLSANENATEALNVAATGNGVSAQLTMNMLDGAPNDAYFSLLVISDAAGIQALQSWSNTPAAAATA